MRKTTKVTIAHKNGAIVVKNSQGKKWTLNVTEHKLGVSASAVIADAAANMLTGTITEYVYKYNAEEIEFTLTIETR